MSSETSAIIILIPGFAADEADINCLPFHQSFVKCFSKNFPVTELFILAFQYPYFSGEYKWHGIQVTSFNGRNKGCISKLLLFRRVQKKIREIIHTKKVKGILSFWCGDCARAGKKAAGRYGLKHYCWIMGQDAGKENRTVNRIRPHEDELIAISGFIQSSFFQNHSVKPRYVIPPGIDKHSFSANTLKKDIDILGAGSLIPLKQYDIFIDVVYEIKKTNPATRAVLCGKGPLEKQLRRRVKEAGLAENVILAGEMPHHELLQLMKRCRIFLHPSSYEGFSVACLEALHAGAEVVSFHQPMKEDIENWHVVPSKELMIKKTKELLQQPAGNNPVLYTSIEETAGKIFQLFFKEDITS